LRFPLGVAILPPRFRTSDFTLCEISVAIGFSTARAVLSGGKWTAGFAGGGVLARARPAGFWNPSPTGFAALHLFRRVWHTLPVVWHDDIVVAYSPRPVAVGRQVECRWSVAGRAGDDEWPLVAGFWTQGNLGLVESEGMGRSVRRRFYSGRHARRLGAALVVGWVRGPRADVDLPGEMIWREGMI